MKKIFNIMLSLLIMGSFAACSGEPDRIEGLTGNPESTPLPPDPSFSGDVTFEACVTAMNKAISKNRCWKRGVSGEDSYSEVWFVPDAPSATTGVLGYEVPNQNSTDVEYQIGTCDTNEIRMTQAGGVRVKVSTSQMDFQFDQWSQAYRYTASNDCKLSPL